MRSGLLFAVLALSIGATSTRAETPVTTWKETLKPDEAGEFARAAETINKIQAQLAKQGDGTVRRGFHAKEHASMRAEFRVLPDLPAYARLGVFKEAKTFPCWVRFSNGIGGIARDRTPDVRGLAIKLVGVTGTKLLEGEEDAQTQDFLMTNAPVSLARDGTQFVAFAEASVNQLTLPATLIGKLGAKEALRILKFLATHVTRGIHSLATETYWSGAPIKLGPYAVKFLVKPEDAEPAPPALFGPADYLKSELTNRLEKHDIKFGFYLQYYVDDKSTPIEDASVEWLEASAPPLKVAELTISKRDLSSASGQAASAFGDSLAFNPWHTTEEMRPLSHIMRLRRAVYASSARFRKHAPEPTGREKF